MEFIWGNSNSYYENLNIVNMNMVKCFSERKFIKDLTSKSSLFLSSSSMRMGS